PREAPELPAPLAAVAAVDGIGEEAFAGVLPQQPEEEARRRRLERERPLLEPIQHQVLLRRLELGEGLAVSRCAEAVRLRDRGAVDLARRERALVALLRRAFRPGAAMVLARHRAEVALELPVDEDRDPSLLGAGAQVVRGDEPRER